MIYPGQKKPEKSPLSDSDSGYPPLFYRAHPVRRKRNTKKRIFPRPPGKRQSSTEISFPYENPSVNRQMKDLSTPCRSSGTVSFSFFKHYPRKILLEILGTHAGVLVHKVSDRRCLPDIATGLFRSWRPARWCRRLLRETEYGMTVTQIFSLVGCRPFISRQVV